MSDTITELRAELESLRNQLTEVTALARRAADRGEIENLFNRYMYLHNAFQDEQIIPLWVKPGTPGHPRPLLERGPVHHVRERDPLPP